MSDTQKDFARQATRRMILDVIANGNGTFEIVVNGQLVGSGIPDERLRNELCVKYGYGGAEFDAIRAQLDDYGRAKITL
jgi:hypothetical protein